MCRERDSNPHSHYWPRDFKSLVSTNSTIAANIAHSMRSAKLMLIAECRKLFHIFYHNKATVSLHQHEVGVK